MWFNSKPQDSVLELQDRSKNVVDVFTRTVEDLKQINHDIQNLSEKKEQEKAKLEGELATLDGQKVSNNKVIEKINKIFE